MKNEQDSRERSDARGGTGYRTELGALVMLCLVVWLPTLRGEFIWDDNDILTNNPIIHAPDGLARIWLTAQAADYFPLTYSLFWLEWRLFGLHPAAYHLVNVLLHTLAVILAWRVLVRLGVPAAAWAAAVFAIHPMQAQTVAWITQHKNTLSAVFFFASICVYLDYRKSRRRTAYLAALILAASAMLAKTSTVMLPVVLLLAAWWREKRFDRSMIAGLIPFFALSAALGMVTLEFQDSAVTRDPAGAAPGFSRSELVGICPWFYFWKFLLPAPLMFVYPRLPSSTVPAMLAGLAWAVILVCLFRMRRRPFCGAALIGLVYYLVMLFPVCGLFDIYFMRYADVSDHWQYLALLGPAAMGAGWIGRLAKDDGPARQSWQAIAGTVLIGIMSVMSAQAQVKFLDNGRLWEDTLEKNRGAWIAHNNLANLLETHGFYPEAEEHYREVIKLNPAHGRAHVNLGNLLSRQGRPDEADTFYREALRVRPDLVSAYYNYGTFLAYEGQLVDARGMLQRALEIDPGHVRARRNLENVMARLEAHE